MTIDEIREAVAQNQDLQKGVVDLALGTEIGKTTITSANETYWKENIGAEVKKIHGIYDEKVKTILGLEKDDAVKSSEFIAKQLEELKELKGKSPEDVKALKDEIKKLKEDSGNDKFWKETYDKEKNQWENELQNKSKMIEDLNLKHTQGAIEGQLSQGLTGLSFNEAIPQSVRDAFIDQAKSDILSRAKVDESGAVTYFKEGGEIWKNANMAQASVKEILAERLKEIVKPEPRQGGNAPTEGKGSIIKVGEGKESTDKLVLDKSMFKTQSEFTALAQKSLLEAGIPRTDSKFRELQTEAFKEYEVDKLELN